MSDLAKDANTILAALDGPAPLAVINVDDGLVVVYCSIGGLSETCKYKFDTASTIVVLPREASA